MITNTKRDPSGNLRYHQEHTKEDPATVYSMLPKSQQFADTGRTLGVASKGFHFTGMTTENQGHDNAIHSGKSLRKDARDDNESFVESRNGTQANPAFKTGGDILLTDGPQPHGTVFTASTSASPAQGGTGPVWWERIKENFRSNTQTQSTNVGVKPPEKFQVGLRAGNVKVQKQDQNNGVGPLGLASTTVTGLNGF